MSHKEYLKQVGMEVRVARIRQSLTQKDLVNLTGLTEGTISDLELGYKDSHILVYKRIVDALGINMRDIL